MRQRLAYPVYRRRYPVRATPILGDGAQPVDPFANIRRQTGRFLLDKPAPVRLLRSAFGKSHEFIAHNRFSCSPLVLNTIAKTRDDVFALEYTYRD